MGNSASKRNEKKRNFRKSGSSTEFQQVEKPDLFQSGILVDKDEIMSDKQQQQEQQQKQPRRKEHLPSVSPTNDKELLEESIEHDRKQRLQQLSKQQKSKRQQAQEENRKGHKKIILAQANPFSRFLSAFSVEPEFPNHKRNHSSSIDETTTVDPSEEQPKRPKLDPEAYSDNGNDYDYWIEQLPWIGAATAVAAVAVVVAMRRNKK